MITRLTHSNIVSLISRDEMGGNYNHFEAKALLYRVANVTKVHPRNVATCNSLKHHKAEKMLHQVQGKQPLRRWS